MDLYRISIGSLLDLYWISTGSLLNLDLNLELDLDLELDPDIVLAPRCKFNEAFLRSRSIFDAPAQRT